MIVKNNGQGRRAKIDKNKVDKIYEFLKAGNYLRTAARLVSIDETTLIRWRNTGREDYEKGKKNIYVDLFLKIGEAEAYAEAYHVQNIRKAADGGTWQASAWYLERKCPQEWGNKYRIEEAKLALMKEKLELEKSQASTYESEDEADDNFIEALGGVAEEVWDDEDIPDPNQE